jgi:hypothetical protein
MDNENIAANFFTGSFGNKLFTNKAILGEKTKEDFFLHLVGEDLIINISGNLF